MVQIHHVTKEYKNGFRKETILQDVSLSIPKGRCTGLVGESGSGKSTLSRLLLGLEQPTGGEILIESQPVKTWRKTHAGEMSVVFQDYTSSVNPRFPVRKALLESLVALGKPFDEQSILEELLDAVRLPSSLLHHLPHELSGGQLQRVCIARAISTHPRLLILDEAISSLDVSVQAQILELLSQLKETYHMTYLFIAHDLQAVTYLCDSLYFLKDGMITASCSRQNLSSLEDPYAKALLSSVIPFSS